VRSISSVDIGWPFRDTPVHYPFDYALSIKSVLENFVPSVTPCSCLANSGIHAISSLISHIIRGPQRPAPHLPWRMALACSRSLALYLCSQLVSPCPGRLSIALALRVFESFLECDFLFAGNVLEEFLDKVDMREDHATAAVALETDGVEGVTGRVGVLAVLI
jgi:hypothetical protein